MVYLLQILDIYYGSLPKLMALEPAINADILSLTSVSSLAEHNTVIYNPACGWSSCLPSSCVKKMPLSILSSPAGCGNIIQVTGVIMVKIKMAKRNSPYKPRTSTPATKRPRKVSASTYWLSNNFYSLEIVNVIFHPHGRTFSATTGYFPSEPPYKVSEY